MPRLLKACPLCNSTSLTPLYQARDPHYGIPGVHPIVHCANCGVVFTNPMPSDQELAQMYPAEYYAYQEEPKTNELKQFCKKILGYWQGVTDPCFDRPGVFLDIGCGSGSHAERMRQIGWKSYGVEFNHAAAPRGAARGLQIFSGNLFQAEFSASFFDSVRASHSLEHMPSPH